LRVQVLPWGSIYIDDKLHKKDTDIQYHTVLASGPHRLRAVHPALGVWEKTVEIRTDELLPVIVDFNKQGLVTVTSVDEAGVHVWAEIYVDHEPTGRFTNGQLSLSVGQHVIEARRQGYTLVGAPQQINIAGEAEINVKFILRRI
jgi:hypothetical protein